MFKKMMAGKAEQGVRLVADVRAMISAEVGEPVIGVSRGTHAAYERGGRGGLGISQRLTSAAVHAVMNAVAATKHLGGSEGSLAMQLPRDVPSAWVALSETTASFWSFDYMTPQDITLVLRLSRDQLTSIQPADAAGKVQGLVRFGFVDGSFVDYTMLRHELVADFWSAIGAPLA